LSTIEGNPTLSSWYFTDQTCLRIEQLWNWSKHQIAFLGTPRVYEWFETANLGERRVLLDLDPLVTRVLSSSGLSDRVLRYDVRDQLPKGMGGQFTCVICDPPWYPDEYALWVERAKELTRGGVLCISLFPPLTRPSSARERREILNAMHADHLSVIMLTEFLEYEIPSFELFQLAEIGLTGLGPWKLADLIIAQLGRSAARSAICSLGARPDWLEIDFGTLRLFVSRTAGRRPEGPLLGAPDGYSGILPSPSRREPMFQVVNVLSSRGHGLVSSDPLRLINILNDLCTRPVNSVTMVEEIARLDIDQGSKEMLSRLLGLNRHDPLRHK